MNSSVLLLMVFAPMLLGFLPVFVKNTKILNTVMVVCAVTELALCMYFLLNYSTIDSQVIAIHWFAGMGIGLKITGFGILQAVATSLIWVGSSVFSDEYLFVFCFLIYNSCIYRVFHIYKRANIAQL